MKKILVTLLILCQIALSQGNAVNGKGQGITDPDAFRNNLGIPNVENTALSTWVGSTNINTLGAITTGTWTGTTIAVANGGTGATSAPSARTNLGLIIGTDVQAYSAILGATTASFLTTDETKIDWLTITQAVDLDAIETKVNGIEALADVTDAANVAAAGALMESAIDIDLKTLVLPATTTISAFGGSLIDDAAASNARTTLGLVIGTDVLSPSGSAAALTSFPTLNQNTTGSAASLTTSRNINSVAFNGSADITVTAAAGTLTGATLNATVTDSSLTSVGTIATGVWQGTAIGAAYVATLNQDTTGYASALKSATTTVSVSAATAPTTGQVLTATGASAATWQTPSGGGATYGTAQTLSGGSNTYSGLPSGLNKITIVISGLSTTSTSDILCRLGDGAIVSTGYLGAGGEVRGTPSIATATNGFVLNGAPANADVMHGIINLHRVDGNLWVYSFTGGASNTTQAYIGGGSLTLSGTLDRVQLLATGADTFDAGTINISYE